MAGLFNEEKVGTFLSSGNVALDFYVSFLEKKS